MSSPGFQVSRHMGHKREAECKYLGKTRRVSGNTQARQAWESGPQRAILDRRHLGKSRLTGSNGQPWNAILVLRAQAKTSQVQARFGVTSLRRTGKVYSQSNCAAESTLQLVASNAFRAFRSSKPISISLRTFDSNSLNFASICPSFAQSCQVNCLIKGS